ncbi:MAG: hypothetical protein PHF44_03310 [Candidatus Pacebacteria bacterium]|nr:hypothetical protein [Candidatus Paceibacterota bacterium]
MKLKKLLICSIPELLAPVFFIITVSVHEFGHYLAGKIFFGGGKIKLTILSGWYLPAGADSFQLPVDLAGGWLVGTVLLCFYFLIKRYRNHHKVIVEIISLGLVAVAAGSFAWGIEEVVLDFLNINSTFPFFLSHPAFIVLILVYIIMLLKNKTFISWVNEMLSSD